MYVSDLNLRSIFDPSSFYAEFVVTAVVMEQVSIRVKFCRLRPQCDFPVTWQMTSHNNPTPILIDLENMQIKLTGLIVKKIKLNCSNLFI
jgi:hypothetical protein